MFTAAVPEPAFAFAVCEPYDVDVPYWTYQVVASPPGTTEPVTVAVVDADRGRRTGRRGRRGCARDPAEEHECDRRDRYGGKHCPLTGHVTPNRGPASMIPGRARFLRTPRKGGVKPLGSRR